jgi:hypothetical protein
MWFLAEVGDKVLSPSSVVLLGVVLGVVTLLVGCIHRWATLTVVPFMVLALLMLLPDPDIQPFLQEEFGRYYLVRSYCGLVMPPILAMAICFAANSLFFKGRRKYLGVGFAVVIPSNLDGKDSADGTLRQ